MGAKRRRKKPHPSTSERLCFEEKNKAKARQNAADREVARIRQENLQQEHEDRKPASPEMFGMAVGFNCGRRS